MDVLYAHGGGDFHVANHVCGREHGWNTRGVVSLSICRKQEEAKLPEGEKAAWNSL